MLQMPCDTERASWVRARNLLVALCNNPDKWRVTVASPTMDIFVPKWDRFEIYSTTYH
jgi:hypothetical protein